MFRLFRLLINCSTPWTTTQVNDRSHVGSLFQCNFDIRTQSACLILSAAVFILYCKLILNKCKRNRARPNRRHCTNTTTTPSSIRRKTRIKEHTRCKLRCKYRRHPQRISKPLNEYKSWILYLPLSIQMLIYILQSDLDTILWVAALLVATFGYTLLSTA